MSAHLEAKARAWLKCEMPEALRDDGEPFGADVASLTALLAEVEREALQEREQSLTCPILCLHCDAELEVKLMVATTAGDVGAFITLVEPGRALASQREDGPPETGQAPGGGDGQRERQVEEWTV